MIRPTVTRRALAVSRATRRATATRDLPHIPERLQPVRDLTGKPLGRYFPEVLDILRSVKERRFLLDGELIIPIGDALSFEALQLRLHPAESRVNKLAKETPAELMAFDLLQVGGRFLLHRSLGERRTGDDNFSDGARNGNGSATIRAGRTRAVLQFDAAGCLEYLEDG